MNKRVSRAEILGGRGIEAEEGVLQSESEVDCLGKAGSQCGRGEGARMTGRASQCTGL